MVREATDADADTIAAVERAAALHPWSREAIASTLALGTTFALLDERDGSAVGHLIASFVADEGEVYTIAVHPDHRRQGRARALLEACEARWRDRGVRHAFLEVHADNTAARALYASCGWNTSGRRRDYYGRGEDAVCMRWETS